MIQDLAKAVKVLIIIVIIIYAGAMILTTTWDALDTTSRIPGPGNVSVNTSGHYDYGEIILTMVFGFSLIGGFLGIVFAVLYGKSRQEYKPPFGGEI